MSGLSASELRILRLLAGLEDGTTHAVSDLSRRFGVTEQRIRELAASGLAKLDDLPEGNDGDSGSGQPGGDAAPPR